MATNFRVVVLMAHNEKVYAVCGGIWEATSDKPAKPNDAKS